MLLLSWLRYASQHRWRGALALPALVGLQVVTAWTMSEPHRWPERLSLPKPELGLLSHRSRR